MFYLSKITINRFIYWLIFLVLTGVEANLIYKAINNEFEYANLDIGSDIFFVFIEIGFPIIIIIFLSLAIASCCLNCKLYRIRVNGKSYSIVVYAGWTHNYLYLDNELVDEYTSLFNYSPVYLCTESDDLYIKTTISLSNRIATKVNHKLVFPE